MRATRQEQPQRSLRFGNRSGLTASGGIGHFIEAHPTGGVSMEDVRAVRVTDSARAARIRKVLDGAGYTNLPVYIEQNGKITHHSGKDAR